MSRPCLDYLYICLSQNGASRLPEAVSGARRLRRKWHAPTRTVWRAGRGRAPEAPVTTQPGRGMHASRHAGPMRHFARHPCSLAPAQGGLVCIQKAATCTGTDRREKGRACGRRRRLRAALCAHTLPPPTHQLGTRCALGRRRPPCLPARRPGADLNSPAAARLRCAPVHRAGQQRGPVHADIARGATARHPALHSCVAPPCCALPLVRRSGQLQQDASTASRPILHPPSAAAGRRTGTGAPLASYSASSAATWSASRAVSAAAAAAAGSPAACR